MTVKDLARVISRQLMTDAVFTVTFISLCCWWCSILCEWTAEEPVDAMVLSLHRFSVSHPCTPCSAVSTSTRLSCLGLGDEALMTTCDG